MVMMLGCLSLQGNCLSKGDPHRGTHEWQIQILNRIAVTSMVLCIFKGPCSSRFTKLLGPLELRLDLP